MKVLRLLAFAVLYFVLTFVGLVIDFCIYQSMPWLIMPVKLYDFVLGFLTVAVFNGTTIFFGTLGISKLIRSVKGCNICIIWVMLLNIYWIVHDLLFYHFSTLIFAFCLNIIVASIAIELRASKIKPIYSTWNLFPDGTAICNNCKHKINFRENPQFICPNCKADMRKPRQ